MLTPEIRELRKTGIGGSDVGAICDASPYKTALKVYMEKIGELTDEAEMSDSQRHGHLMEPIILKEYYNANRELYPNMVLDVKPLPQRSKAYNFMIANYDAVYQSTNNNDIIIVDAKYMHSRSRYQWGEPGSANMPDYIKMQAIHYAIVSGAEKVDIAVFFCRPQLLVYTYHRNATLEEKTIEIESRFWHHHVLAKVPPDVKTVEDCKLMWKSANKDSIVKANSRSIAAWNSLKEVRSIIKQSEAQKEKLEVIIKSEMKEAETLVDDSGFVLATWKNQPSGRLKQKEMAKAYPEIVKKYKDNSKNRVFKVNEKE